MVSSSTAKDGYDAARDQGNHVDSVDSYVGIDKDGNKATIRFHLSAAPGQEPMFVVTEIKLD